MSKLDILNRDNPTLLILSAIQSLLLKVAREKTPPCCLEMKATRRQNEHERFASLKLVITFVFTLQK